jgi:hypothetical protein
MAAAVTTSSERVSGRIGIRSTASAARRTVSGTPLLSRPKSSRSSGRNAKW